MSLGRAAGAAVVAVVVGVGVVGSSLAFALDRADDGDGKPSWKGQSSEGVKSPQADRIAPDRVGDAARGVDIQSLAVFNRKNLDYVGMAITGRDFNLPMKRSIEVFLGIGKDPGKPGYRLVATNDGRSQEARKVRLYRVKGWAGSGTRVKCEKLRVQFDTDHESQVRIAIPRSCIGGGRQGVSANASVTDDSSSGSKKSRGNHTDSVPNERKLTRRAH